MDEKSKQEKEITEKMAVAPNPKMAAAPNPKMAALENEIRVLNIKLSQIADSVKADTTKVLSKREELACRFTCALLTPNNLDQSVKIPIEKGFRFANELMKQGG